MEGHIDSKAMIKQVHEQILKLNQNGQMLQEKVKIEHHLQYCQLIMKINFQIEIVQTELTQNLKEVNIYLHYLTF